MFNNNFTKLISLAAAASAYETIAVKNMGEIRGVHDLDFGEQLKLWVVENPSTGYTWSYGHNDLFDVRDKYHPGQNGRSGMVGVTGRRVFTITAGNEEGTDTFRACKSRAYQGRQECFSIMIRVNDNQELPDDLLVDLTNPAKRDWMNDGEGAISSYN